MTIQKNKGEKLEDTGERMIPEFHEGQLMYAEHLTRYLSAQELVKDKVVLDVASGSGYGVKILSEKAKKVYGVDVDKASVKYSQKNFSGKNIEYMVGDGERIPLEDNSVDVVTTFETIEHVPDYKKFVKEIKRVLKPDGIAIVSTPNDVEFAEGNHFHLHEFEYKELVDLLRKDFKNIDSYFQGTWKYVAIGSDEAINSSGEMNIKLVNLSKKTKEEYLYFYLVCSNREIIEKVQPLAAVGGHYSDRQLIAEREQMQKAIARLEPKIKILEASLADSSKHSSYLQNQRDRLAEEITLIKESNTYKIAQKLAKIKGKVAN